MSIKLRLALLLGGLLVGLTLALAMVRKLERREALALRATARAERDALLERWLARTERSLGRLVDQMAASGPRIHAAANDGPGEHAPALAESGLAALWLIGADGGVIRTFGVDAATASPPPFAPAVLAKEFSSGRAFDTFAEWNGRFVQAAARPLASGETAATPAWLLAVRHWDDEHLRTLADLTESSVRLAAPDAESASRPPSSRDRIALTRTLHDVKGTTLRVLHLDHRLPGAAIMAQTDARASLVTIAFGLLLIAGVGVGVHRWVLQPLNLIGESLALDDPRPLQSLHGNNDELARVARLVEIDFTHRQALAHEIEERTRAEAALRQSEASLQRTLEERTRLGRDLHDGVIQSLYAAGMGLAGVKALLLPEQIEAATRLEQSRAALNETIHDVRNFIVGLEPEALKHQTFSQAVSKLVEFLQTLRPFRATVNIDEDLANRLSLAQRVHALQIAREAVSNGLRHGEADYVQISLQPAGYMTAFEIHDNGRGFSPTASTSASGGHGLANFVERAREFGGHLTVESEPGHGTRVKLVFAQTHTS